MNFRNSKAARASLVATVSLALMIPSFSQVSQAATDYSGKVKMGSTVLPTVSTNTKTTPVIGKPSGTAPTTLIIKDVTVGKGTSAVNSSTVTANYVLMSWKTGKVVESSWGSSPAPTFPLSGVIAGWQKGIPGMKVGGRRLLVIPPALAYGATGQGPIGPNETLVFVVDLVGVTPPAAPTVLPSVSTDTKVAPVIGKASGGAPTTLISKDITVGTGKSAVSSSTVTAQYVVASFKTGTVYQTSWTAQPFTSPLSNLIPGWQQGIPGMKVGGRRLFIIPPSLAYGAQGAGNIPANETLIFVVDLLAVK